MPLYEYQCQSCDHRFERIQKFSDDQVRECPSCGGEVDKLVSSPAIRFKGSGFYITDYAAKPESAEKSGEDKAPAGKDSDKADSGKKDAKKADTGGTTSDASASKPKEGASKNQGASTATKSSGSKSS